MLFLLTGFIDPLTAYLTIYHCLTGWLTYLLTD